MAIRNNKGAVKGISHAWYVGRRWGVLTFRVLVAVLALNADVLFAQDSLFVFKPQRLGSVLPRGDGWIVDRPIATLSGSPEFTFPLQLVYLSVRTQHGLFSDQWFCPQLESFVLPKGPQAILWQTLSGNEIALFADKQRVGFFRDKSEAWLAKLKGQDIEITNSDGWRFLYKSGRLLSLTSPTGRVLEFSYKGSATTEVTLRDPASGSTQLLVQATYDPKNLVQSLQVCGLRHTFTYDSHDGRLLSWTHPGQPQPDRFAYGKTGELASI